MRGRSRGQPDRWTLIVFARAPAAGQVKTRLIAALGADGAAELQRTLLRQTLQRAGAARGARVEVWLAGQADARLRLDLRRQGIAAPFEQFGAGLGERMSHAMADAMARNGGRCVLIGSDCPAQTTADLEQAAAALLSHGVVLQPAHDGGYVLIGLAQPQPALFESVDWGSAHVCGQTEARAASLGLALLRLRPLPDLDTEADLQRAIEHGWLPH
jgi:uncharacterized protein